VDAAARQHYPHSGLSRSDDTALSETVGKTNECNFIFEICFRYPTGALHLLMQYAHRLLEAMSPPAHKDQPGLRGLDPALGAGSILEIKSD
jgi:hypothetical protein